MLNENTIDKDSDIIMPRPTFDIFKYDDSSLINFLKILIEDSMKDNNRKNNYNLYKKISVDKDNSHIIKIINKMLGKEYKSFEYIKSNYEINGLRLLWSILYDKVCWEYSCYISYYNMICKQKNINNKKEKSKFMAKVYTNIWANYFGKMIRNCKNEGDDSYIQFDDDDPLFSIIRYKIIWNLWIRITNKVFQYICIHCCKKEESINGLIDELNLLIQEAEKDKGKEKHEENIADGYYKYYYMLETSSILNMELIGLDFINRKGSIFLREEDLFVDEENNIKKEFTDINKIEISKLNKLFNSGRDCTKNETFKKNIEYCKKFISIYNRIAGRNIPENNIKNLRAVYRALFVNKTPWKKLNTHNISKKIIDLYEKEKEHNTINAGNPDMREAIYKNTWNDMHKEDAHLNEHNYILGNAISNAILLEQIYGYNTIKAKCKFIEVFYKLALLIFYRDCPGMDASNKDIVCALNKIEYNFDKILEKLVKIIDYGSQEEEA